MWQTLKVALFLGYKSIAKGNRATLALMIFIMSLAFVNLVFISSILNGIVVAINKQVKTNIVSNIVIEPQEEPVKKDSIIHQEELRRQVENLSGVVATVRHYKLTGTAAYDKEKNGKFEFASAEIIGIDPEEERQMTEVAQSIVDGRYLEGLGSGEIVLGSALAGGYGGGDELTSLGGVKAGEKIRVTFSNGLSREYRVRGIFKVNFGFADRQAFVTSKEAESVLSVYDNASQILVKTSSDAADDQIIGEIKRIAPNLRVRKWSEYVGELAGVTKSFDSITLVISTIGLAVAAITIFILIYVNVVNKRRQIGILKAIGIKQNIIIYSYILQALFYAISGVIIGMILIFYLIAPYFTQHPLDLPIGRTSLALDSMRVIYSITGLILAALIAGLLPSWRGAKENILQAIWGA